MSKRRLLYVVNVLKMSLERYECLKDVFYYVMDVSKMSFLRYECLKDVFCMLRMSKKCHCMFWMTNRRLMYVADV